MAPNQNPKWQFLPSRPTPPRNRLQLPYHRVARHFTAIRQTSSLCHSRLCISAHSFQSQNTILLIPTQTTTHSRLQTAASDDSAGGALTGQQSATAVEDGSEIPPEETGGGMIDADGHPASNRSMADDAPTAVEEELSAGSFQSPHREAATSPPSHRDASACNDHNAPAQAAVDADSEAETLIQSPEKRRLNPVESAPKLPLVTGHGGEGRGDDNGAMTSKSPSGEGVGRKRKRSCDESSGKAHRLSPRQPSPLASPTSHARSVVQASARSEHRNSSIKPSSESVGENESNKESGKRVKKSPGQRSRSPTQQQRSKSEFEDDQSRTSRQRNSPEIGSSGRRGIRSATYPRQDSPNPSRSPRPGDGQKRMASTQSIQTLASHKTRRVPAPLNTRRNGSPDRSSEASNSPAPTRPSLFKLTPTDNEATSPAKVMAKKLRDRHGRTWLAQACTDDKLDRVKQMYEERPQDLNVADNAGNSPVQIAALQGYVEIVEFLVDKNCEVNTRNIEKDTPLIDAVENGHVEVVKLLLDHEADPRLGNATGQKPLELVDEDDDAIRKLLIDAKDKSLHRRQSEDHAPPSTLPRENSSRAASAASPRDSSPVHGPRSPPVIQLSRRRAREQTRNDLLWQANTPENLTKLAGKGDTEGVVNILNILNRAAPEALIAACKGGHDEVLQLLIAMGNPDPDPEPVLSQDQRRGYNTPMLAAIGEGNIQSTKLLLAQDGFNPTREFRGRTYFEISEERKGDNWAEEAKALKVAYDEYQERHSKPSTARKAREAERRRAKESSSPLSKQDRTLLRGQGNGHAHKVDKSIDVKASHRQIASDDHSAVVSSDHDHRTFQRKGHKVRRSRSDALNAHSEEEVRKKRRLVSRKEHLKGYGEVGRASSGEEHLVDVKREEEGASIPRRRTSVAAHSASTLDMAPLKKRSRRALSDSSPEDARIVKRRMSNQGLPVGSVAEAEVLRGVDKVLQTTQPNQKPRLVSTHESSVLDEGRSSTRPSPEAEKECDQTGQQQELERLERVEKEKNAAEALAIQEQEELDKAVREEQQRAAAEEEERLSIERKRAEAAAAAQKKAEEVAAAQKKAEEAAAAQKRAEEVAAAQKRAEEVAAAQKKAEEVAAAKKKAEEEALAAAAKRKADEEALARKREEEEERQERMRREVEEKQRRAEERRQRILRENEQRRMEALPRLLCQSAKLLDQNSAEAKSTDFLCKFLPLFTVKTRQIDQHCSGDVAEEDWIPGFQAAPLLAAKNLGLEHFTHWEKRRVSDQERPFLWKVARAMLIQGGGDDHQNQVGVGRDHFDMSIEQAFQLERETRPKFQAMQPLVWVKFSDFRERLPLHPYLQALPIRTQKIGLRMPKPNLPPPFNPTFNSSPSPGSSPACHAQPAAAMAPVPSPPLNHIPHASDNGSDHGSSVSINGVLPNGVGIGAREAREGREGRGGGGRGLNGFHNDPPHPLPHLHQ